jgi:hypothetical protein
MELDAEPPLPPGLSHYEHERLKNIEANRKMMAYVLWLRGYSVWVERERDWSCSL